MPGGLFAIPAVAQSKPEETGRQQHCRPHRCRKSRPRTMELKIHQEIKTVVDNTSRTSGQQNSCGVKSKRRANPTKNINDEQTQQKHHTAHRGERTYYLKTLFSQCYQHHRREATHKCTCTKPRCKCRGILGHGHDCSICLPHLCACAASAPFAQQIPFSGHC